VIWRRDAGSAARFLGEPGGQINRRHGLAGVRPVASGSVRAYIQANQPEVLSCVDYFQRGHLQRGHLRRWGSPRWRQWC